MRVDYYVTASLELHLFFGRIMKEHSLFLRAGFTPAEPEYAEKAEFYRNEFEALLHDTVRLADGVVSKEALCANEFVTEFTILAEDQTQCLTGIPIDQRITEDTLCLHSGSPNQCKLTDLQKHVRQLNRRALKLLDGLISFKENVLNCVLSGKIFTTNYPLLIEHIIREAKLYRKYVQILEKDGTLSEHTMRELECFGNQIMMEHAQFIRGLLDPCETDLIKTADKFSKEYCALLETSRSVHNKAVRAVSLEETLRFRDFKAAGAQGIQQNKIRSIILPLLADHVLREANHYIRLLNS